MGISARAFLIHSLLFLATVLTLTLAGVQWLNKNPFELENFSLGVGYALLITVFLGAHEFGHYFAAKAHGVETTLPYFLPFPSFLNIAPFGTFGAVIRIKSPLNSRRTLLDIGAAGPIAGFVVSVATLIVGFLTLPPIGYLYAIHPEYAKMASLPAEGLTFGSSALYWVLERTIPPSGSFVPPMNEIYHYPFLCAGWFGLFVTGLNLIPVGQLDGGHVAYALFNERYHRIGQSFLILLMVLGTLGLLPFFGFAVRAGWTGWLLWAIILAFMMQNSRLRHPALHDDTELTPARIAVGWACIVIFFLTFMPIPVSE